MYGAARFLPPIIVSSPEQHSPWARLWPWKLTGSQGRFTPKLTADRTQCRLGVWIFVNVASTVAIVFTNKAIFAQEAFRNCQVAFAAYHFFLTSLTLWIASRSWCGFFTPKRVPIWRTLHIAVLTSLQVILQNFALAFSSVIFHQLVRLLLTPLTAILNFFIYRITIPRASIAPLVLMCGGVGMVSYYDTLPKVDGDVTTSSQGAAFAFTGVLASALYTIFVGRYHRTHQVSSAQLLANQAPMSAVLLLSACVSFDEWPSLSADSSLPRGPILLSGVLACLVNLSQLFVIDGVGAVTSTVIGYLKTCIIIGLGWALRDREISAQSILGIILALTGMTLYMIAVLKNRG